MNRDREAARDLSKRLEKAQEEKKRLWRALDDITLLAELNDLWGAEVTNAREALEMAGGLKNDI